MYVSSDLGEMQSMASYRIGQHRIKSDCIELHRTMSTNKRS